ncbi:acyltransferase [Gleimia sp. 6138-11-ORH1]|uniref:acyltransferase family protein n=1 Tax=Gleimia sp. 6138-11-ORH1 TaxID=2973937 RepID=UPI00216713BC|nr:acyltransferase [Gleimia sp. 6138-11-ORH1]MCS4484036.1 acyltransferase [Gleimia sp. 6138-11-ORH1]
MTNTPKRIRLDSLTGIRWWAAFGVFIYHYDIVGRFPGSKLGAIGYTGVAFFFVLSGFVLTWSASPQVTRRQFWMRRVARIWPAHLVALLIALPIFYPWNGPTPGNWWEKEIVLLPILASIFLVHGLSMNSQVIFAGNPASWTLSNEASFYFSHPFVNRYTSSFQRTKLVLFILIVLLVGFISVRYANVTPPVVNRFWEFFLGMIVAQLVKQDYRLNIPAWPTYFIVIGLAVGYYLLTVRGWYPQFATMLQPFYPFILPIIYAILIWMLACSDLSGRHSFLRTKPMVIAGEISYAFYLVHATVLYAYLGWWGRTNSLLIFFTLFAVSFVLAAALHYGVERPCEKRIRAWGDKKFGKTS